MGLLGKILDLINVTTNTCKWAKLDTVSQQIRKVYNLMDIHRNGLGLAPFRLELEYLVTALIPLDDALKSWPLM